MRNEGSVIKLGTKAGHILLPFEVTLHENPLSYNRNAKASIDRNKLSFDRKKLSFEAVTCDTLAELW